MRHTAGPHRLATTISACIAALLTTALLPSTALALPGDVNCNGAVDTSDIGPFVLALLDPAAAYPNCEINRADMNADAQINGHDTQGFVSALLARPCPPGLTWCDPGCVDLMSDPYNCGARYHQCAPNEVCAGGVCQGF
jgi:hypothetical protein